MVAKILEIAPALVLHKTSKKYPLLSRITLLLMVGALVVVTFAYW